MMKRLILTECGKESRDRRAGDGDRRASAVYYSGDRRAGAAVYYTAADRGRDPAGAGWSNL